MANLDSMQEAQLTYLKKKVEDLRDVHKEEKKTVERITYFFLDLFLREESASLACTTT